MNDYADQELKVGDKVAAIPIKWNGSARTSLVEGTITHIEDNTATVRCFDQPVMTGGLPSKNLLKLTETRQVDIGDIFVNLSMYGFVWDEARLRPKGGIINFRPRVSRSCSIKDSVDWDGPELYYEPSGGNRSHDWYCIPEESQEFLLNTYYSEHRRNDIRDKRKVRDACNDLYPSLKNEMQPSKRQLVLIYGANHDLSQRLDSYVTYELKNSGDRHLHRVKVDESSPFFLAVGGHNIPLLVSYCDGRAESFYSFSDEIVIGRKKVLSPGLIKPTLRLPI